MACLQHYERAELERGMAAIGRMLYRHTRPEDVPEDAVMRLTLSFKVGGDEYGHLIWVPNNKLLELLAEEDAQSAEGVTEDDN